MKIKKKLSLTSVILLAFIVIFLCGCGQETVVIVVKPVSSFVENVQGCIGCLLIFILIGVAAYCNQGMVPMILFALSPFILPVIVFFVVFTLLKNKMDPGNFNDAGCLISAFIAFMVAGITSIICIMIFASTRPH